jgi:hypothetical protein
MVQGEAEFKDMKSKGKTIMRPHLVATLVLSACSAYEPNALVERSVDASTVDATVVNSIVADAEAPKPLDASVDSAKDGSTSVTCLSLMPWLACSDFEPTPLGTGWTEKQGGLTISPVAPGANSNGARRFVAAAEAEGFLASRGYRGEPTLAADLRVSAIEGFRLLLNFTAVGYSSRHFDLFAVARADGRVGLKASALCSTAAGKNNVFGAETVVDLDTWVHAEIKIDARGASYRIGTTPTTMISCVQYGSGQEEISALAGLISGDRRPAQVDFDNVVVRQ